MMPDQMRMKIVQDAKDLRVGEKSGFRAVQPGSQGLKGHLAWETRKLENSKLGDQLSRQTERI
jgi:hypothetical protein